MLLRQNHLQILVIDFFAVFAVFAVLGGGVGNFGGDFRVLPGDFDFDFDFDFERVELLLFFLGDFVFCFLRLGVDGAGGAGGLVTVGTV